MKAKIPALLALVGLLTGCMLSQEQAFKAPEGKTVTVIRLTGEYDGEPIGEGFGDVCDLLFLDAKGQPITDYRRDKEKGYIIVHSAEERVELDAIACRTHKLFYGKVRRKEFANLYFEPKKGYINYLGTVEALWEPDAFKGGDLILGGMGGVTEDEGKLIMKVNHEIESLQDYIIKEDPAGSADLTIRTIFFNDNRYFVK